MTLEVQLALEGGGAKVCELMAVMEVVQTLEAEGVLKVKRIAGTSAGALVGCLFGAGISMDTLRQTLKAGEGEKLLGWFPTIGWGRYLKLGFLGIPFWDTNRLEKWLEQKFRDKGMYKLTDLKTEVLVIYADLDTTEIAFHASQDIVSAIIDSCGLPYFFRTWKKSGGSRVAIDGGIGENLPSDYLRDRTEPVIAITFEPTPKKSPDNLKNFTLAILETAMNNSISRSKKNLNDDSLHVVKTKIETFDFEKALEEGLDASYELTKERAEKFFRKFVEQKEQENKANQEVLLKKNKGGKSSEILADFWADRSNTTTHIMDQLGQVYQTQHAEQKFRYLKCSFAVQANCLLDKEEVLFGTPDWYTCKLAFEAIDTPIYCISVALDATPESEFLGDTKWTVTDLTRQELVKTIDVPSRNPLYPENRELLLYFDPIIQPKTGPYELRCINYARLLMGDLLNKKEDMIEFYPSRVLGPVGQIDLVVYLPNHLKGSVFMKSKPGNQPGEVMSEKQLNAYEPMNGFYSLGWTGKDITVDAAFGVDIFRT